MKESSMGQTTTPLLLLITLHTILLHGVHSEICTSSICEYDFAVHRQRNLIWLHPVSNTVYDVAMVAGTLQTVASPFRPPVIHGPFLGEMVDDVITTDGVKRSLLTINRQFPPPNIEVMEGAEVVVHVQNRLLDQTITLHWHGLIQRGNPWMDGVPMVTQCPIPPFHNFTYRFVADPVGTHWYHSHVGHQRADGLSGLVVVHKQPPTMDYFNVLVQDWFPFDAHHIESTSIYTTEAYSSGDQAWTLMANVQVDGTEESILGWSSALINGRGRLIETEPWPLTEFDVYRLNTYRFRIANVGTEFPFSLSIDSHTLRIVALDGMDIDPITVDFVIINLGERADVEVIMDQADDNYYMRARTLKDLTLNPDPCEVKAIIRYSRADPDLDPVTDYQVCTALDPCYMFNCRFISFPPSFNINCINIELAQHTYTAEERLHAGLDQVEPDVELFLNAKIHTDHITFNGYTFMEPTTPVYQTDSYNIPCDSCPPAPLPCECTPTVQVPLNQVVQIVLSNYNLDPMFPPLISHPIHLHGQHFAVVKAGYGVYTYGDPQYSIAASPHPDVTCDGILCRNARWTSGSQPADLNLVDPPLKDTVNIPSSSYVVIRFRADNPGPWLIHCHISHHENGRGSMKFLIQVGEFQFPPVPPNMPTCTGAFELDSATFSRQLALAQEAARTGGLYQQIQVPPPPPAPTQLPMCPKPEEGDRGVGTGILVAWIIGSLFTGITVALVVALLVFACYCRRPHMRRKDKQPVFLPSTQMVVPPMSVYGNRLYVTSLPGYK